jgi:hypothetical protein
MNSKDPIDHTRNRLVTYINDGDYEDFMMILADRHMKAGEYLRLLLIAHLEILREKNLLVTPADAIEEDL